MKKQVEEQKTNPPGYPWEWPDGHYRITGNGFHVESGRIILSIDRHTKFSEVSRRREAVRDLVEAHNRFLIRYSEETEIIDQRNWDGIFADLGMPRDGSGKRVGITLQYDGCGGVVVEKPLAGANGIPSGPEPEDK